MSPRAKETIYMCACMVKVIEYKAETQTIQCHLEGYSWKKRNNNTSSQLKKRNNTGSRSLHIMNECSIHGEGNYNYILGYS